MAFPKNKARKIVVKEVLYRYVISRGPSVGALSLRVQCDTNGKQTHFVAIPKGENQEFTPKHVEAAINGIRDLDMWKMELSGDSKPVPPKPKAGPKVRPPKKTLRDLVL